MGVAHLSVLDGPGPAGSGFERPVKVFEADPDLLSGVDPATARLPGDGGVVDSIVVAEGPWTPPSLAEIGEGALGRSWLAGLLPQTNGFPGGRGPDSCGGGAPPRPWGGDAPG